MSVQFKIANSGINALTDTNPKNFSVYVDGSVDHVLIKEFTRNTVAVAPGTTTIAHNLGYLPSAMVVAEVSSGVFQDVFGDNGFSALRAYVDTTNLYLRNGGGSNVNFTYYIFHDQL